MGRQKMFQALGNQMLNPGDRLVLSRACGHDGVLTRAQAFAAFGRGAAPRHVRSRARCSACGKRGSAGVLIP